MSEKTRVIDKRNVNDSTRRRRECLKCKKRFTTYERVEDFNLMVIKKDGRHESFDRNKLKAGILKACEKRFVSAEKIDKMVNEIETKLRSHDKTEIPSKFIGELVMNKLKQLDKVAYIRFASVYREFRDVRDFKRELNAIE
jgi:transcriptional repressor NrdR